ncbi:cytidine deaminase [Coralliovum pocilloporae]|uniref:cytidine deaminase n=1 Tax=Coralliovum pocilloporae TaxID=3066369 RepID=UPI003306C33F
MANDLFEAARAAQEKAYAPYSNFPVGAAIRAGSGAIYTGCNVENASYPEGWCAETSAIGQMVVAGDLRIVEICVIGSADMVITPCGGCRQRLAEFSSPETRVFAAGPDGIRATYTMADLLPAAFSLEQDRSE